MRRRQQGAALVVVLSLLTMSLMLGVTSMQSSMIDERLAGNYRAQSEAQMAAEYGGSAEFPGSASHGKGVSCADAAEYPNANVGLEEWGDERSAGAEGVYYRSLTCTNSEGRDVQLFMGYVRPGDVIIAHRFLMVGEGAEDEAGVPFPDGIFDYAILSGGPYTMNPASSVSGESKMNAGTHNVPDPRSRHPADPTRTGFIDEVKAKLASGDGAVVESCDSSFSRGAASIVFCDGVFEGDVDSRLDGMTVVADGSLGGKKGLKVKGDVAASFVSSGEIRFKGFGNKEISGLIWASGSISLSGRSNISGSIVSNGAIAFNGRTEVTGGEPDEPGEVESGGMLWEPM
ncbi:pilus assembly PilX family protein [Halomonas borealis]|uniref:pilus assembly PilX family protein n=1 Tax=Halomonas borealis TaxID=2508710 RepID=UPI00109F5EEC|nr:PilX N-terminal domain-containing pilus assembly protein [Halomonas borealis]